MKYGLEDSLLEKIIDTIVSYKNVKKIILFGSRATGEFINTSDIDIAIVDSKWEARDINLIKNSLEEQILTPLKFDIVNLLTLNKKELKREILDKGIIIYES